MDKGILGIPNEQEPDKTNFPKSPKSKLHSFPFFLGVRVLSNRPLLCCPMFFLYDLLTFSYQLIKSHPSIVAHLPDWPKPLPSLVSLGLLQSNVLLCTREFNSLQNGRYLSFEQIVSYVLLLLNHLLRRILVTHL